MKKFWIMAIFLLLVIACMASALAESAMFATPLSLKDKIQKVKDRSYLSDGVDNKIIRSSGKTNSTQLPSVLEMDGCGEVLKYYVKDNGYKLQMYYNFDDPSSLDFVRKYVDVLVEDYGYELTHDGTEDTILRDYCHSNWYLEHPDSAIGKDKPISEDYGKCDVYIVLNQYYDFDESSFTINYVSDLTHADAGNAGSSGGGSSSSKRCSNCGGDGRCNTCGGSGQVWKWAGDMYAYVRCTAFGCSGGRCTKCS